MKKAIIAIVATATLAACGWPQVNRDGFMYGCMDVCGGTDTCQASCRCTLSKMEKSYSVAEFHAGSLGPAPDGMRQIMTSCGLPVRD